MGHQSGNLVVVVSRAPEKDRPALVEVGSATRTEGAAAEPEGAAADASVGDLSLCPGSPESVASPLGAAGEKQTRWTT